MPAHVGYLGHVLSSVRSSVLVGETSSRPCFSFTSCQCILLVVFKCFASIIIICLIPSLNSLSIFGCQGMIPIKVILVLAILSTAIAAGMAVYTVYEDENFSIVVELLSARQDGNDILVDIEIRFENRLDVSVILERVHVTVLDSDRTKIHVDETIIPPAVLIEPHSTTARIFQNLRLTNIDSLEGSVMVKISAKWSDGSGGEYRITREQSFDIADMF